MPTRRRAGSAHAVPTTTGAVLIDIDATCGALVVRGDSELCGRECFCQGSDGRARHVWFLRREVPGGFVVAAVLDRLPEDLYELWVEGAPGRMRVRVPAGGIVELAWMPACPGVRGAV